jgi:poly(3-hydroxybutyrate) depolymerase
MRCHGKAELIGVIALGCLLHVARALAQDLPRGQIIDDVKCAGDPTQSYALYLPSSYSPERAWSLLVGFHPGARGRAIVETYRAAAEQYGFVVAGSNNSRNGSWQVSGAAAQAMAADLGQRFAIDEKRFYLTGLSGGSRVALQFALGNKVIAGVIASSAGYPDSQPRKTLPFVIFGTAGTEDFNYIEMRLLDRALTTPHRLAVFEGGHALPPATAALDAIEWLELQAMKSGRKTADNALIDRLLEKRQREIASAPTPAATVRLLRNVVDDFTGLRDVAPAAARAAELSKTKEVKNALGRERADDDAEARQLDDLFGLEAALLDDSRRMESLGRLRDLLTRVARQAAAEADSPDRRRARRLLRTITVGAAERVHDTEYQKLLDQYRTPGAR